MPAPPAWAYTHPTSLSLAPGTRLGFYDVAKDGRFLMIDQVGDDQNLVVVPNWRTELRRLVSEKGR
jgi:hypothetical protein